MGTGLMAGLHLACALLYFAAALRRPGLFIESPSAALKHLNLNLVTLMVEDLPRLAWQLKLFWLRGGVSHWSHQLGSVFPGLVPGALLKQCCSWGWLKLRVWGEQVTEGQHVLGVSASQIHRSVVPHCWCGSGEAPGTQDGGGAGESWPSLP